MKKFKVRNLIIILLLLLSFIFTTSGVLYIHYTKSMGKDKTVTFVIEKGMGNNSIGNSLYKEELIRSSKFFVFYLKLHKINDIKAGTYNLNQSMDLEEIVNVLRKGNNYNNDEISITFKEGINMREIAKVIASKTNNSYDDVIKKNSDKEYLKKLIDKYWFLTDDILDSKIYYPLEGYLYPDTYRFKNQDVSVEEIFNKLLNEMDKVLSNYKDDITKSKYSVHELLTIASIAEKEVNNAKDRKKVVSVFLNRLNKKMSLGSDVTTRYSIKIDTMRALTKKEYATVNAYNTRSQTMAGKLPASAIAMVSKSSIEASLYPEETEYLYFISNIKTDETFFFKYSSDFEKKKQELANVNNGY